MWRVQGLLVNYELTNGWIYSCSDTNRGRWIFGNFGAIKHETLIRIKSWDESWVIVSAPLIVPCFSPLCHQKCQSRTPFGPAWCKFLHFELMVNRSFLVGEPYPLRYSIWFSYISPWIVKYVSCINACHSFICDRNLSFDKQSGWADRSSHWT